MNYDCDDEPAKISAAERKKALAAALAALKKIEPEVQPVQVKHRMKLAVSFWGRAWCRYIETYHELDQRYNQGRSLLRSGAVLDLVITVGKVNARVFDGEWYSVALGFVPMEVEKWAEFVAKGGGKIDSVLSLLAGKVPAAVAELIADYECGLFPATNEISFSCSCLDDARVCRHSTAVLYSLGVRFDETPDLFFVLRRVDPQDLVQGLSKELGKEQSDSAELGKLFEVDFE
jgi:uncharacterized Zn finger protein